MYHTLLIMLVFILILYLSALLRNYRHFHIFIYINEEADCNGTLATRPAFELKIAYEKSSRSLILTDIVVRIILSMLYPCIDART